MTKESDLIAARVLGFKQLIDNALPLHTRRTAARVHQQHPRAIDTRPAIAFGDKRPGSIAASGPIGGCDYR